MFALVRCPADRYSRWLVVGKRKAYPSDLTDEQWAVVGPFLDAWKAKHPSVSGHQGRYQLREIVNAIFYQNRTGCQWAYLPHDLPPKSATYYYFALWRDDGTDQTIHDLLRCQAREKAGRTEDPSAVVLDTQSVRAANHVPAATTGKDAAKKVPGRKRGLAVDTLGLIIAVVVMAASATDNQIGVSLIDRVVEHTPTVTKAWVDAGFKDDVQIHGAINGIDVEQVKRSDTKQGFVPVAKRWIVEQVHGTLMLHRRLVREYETRLASSESRTWWAATANLVRRLTGTTTPTWRQPLSDNG
jgi:transposase